MTGQEMYAQLRVMHNRSGEGYYHRIQLAKKLLRDKEWVNAAECGGGDENKAIDRLENQCFPDISCFISLPTMLNILHRFPQLTVWRQNKFNLRKMAQLLHLKDKPARPKLVPVGEYCPPEEPDDVDKEYQRLRREYTKATHKLAHAQQQLTDLRKQLRTTGTKVG
jgi:hypothetical protein